MLQSSLRRINFFCCVSFSFFFIPVTVWFTHNNDGAVIMLRLTPFTIITGGAEGADWKAEVLARSYNLDVKVLLPPCHPRSRLIPPLTYAQLAQANPWIIRAQETLQKRLHDTITRQYIQRNYCVVEQADLVLAFTLFQPNKSVFGLQVNNVCMGGTGWAVEFAKLLRKPLYVYDVDLELWYWYDHDGKGFEQCDGMTEQQICLPTFVPKTAIVGLRNLFDFPNAVREMELTFQRSLML